MRNVHNAVALDTLLRDLLQGFPVRADSYTQTQLADFLSTKLVQVEGKCLQFTEAGFEHAYQLKPDACW